jgi:hypothetical protein
MFLYSTVSTLNPIVGIVVTISPNFSLYKIVVLPTIQYYEYLYLYFLFFFLFTCCIEANHLKKKKKKKATTSSETTRFEINHNTQISYQNAHFL